MTSYPVDVSAAGAVLLGDQIACDGFHRDCLARIQTHVHDDHMDSFETSKGFQDVYMSEPTWQLLVVQFNADLDVRENLHVLRPDVTHTIGDAEVMVVPSGHMLGAIQVAVGVPNGMRLGYSGDFYWPLDEVIEVDALVVDSTYGNPESRREYSQGEAEEVLLELVTSKLKTGSVNIKAARGTLERALDVLSGNLTCPMLGSPRLCREVEVYRAFSHSIDPILSTGSPEGDAALAGERHIKFYGKGDRLPVEFHDSVTITLSAYMVQGDNPLLEYSERAFRVALSDHADFEGTLEYVRETGAEYVVTDNTRSGHAMELALEITARLGIPARPSQSEVSYEWGA